MDHEVAKKSTAISLVYDALAPMPKKASELNQSILLFLLFLASGGKDTSRAARAPPLRDAYCTLDRAIYRSWALPAPCVCARVRATSRWRNDERLVFCETQPLPSLIDSYVTDFRGLVLFQFLRGLEFELERPIFLLQH